MKNWLLLVFLPFLLLVQQEAGATPIYVSTSASGATYGYEMRFSNVTASSFDYLFTFNPSNVDLHSIPPLVTGGTGGTCTPDCPTVPGSLIKAWIVKPPPPGGTGGYIPFSKIVDLDFDFDGNGDVIITGNESPDGDFSRSVTAFFDSNGDPIPGGTIEGKYTFVCDQNCSDFEITDYYTCIQTETMLGTSCGATDNIRPIEVAVPVVNSFMLLGIGLMALGIPRRRGKLS